MRLDVFDLRSINLSSKISNRRPVAILVNEYCQKSCVCVVGVYLCGMCICEGVGRPWRGVCGYMPVGMYVWIWGCP